MREQIWWYLARASGIAAWVVISLSVLWGLALSTRVLGRPGIEKQPRALVVLDEDTDSLQDAASVLDDPLRILLGQQLDPRVARGSHGCFSSGIRRYWQRSSNSNVHTKQINPRFKQNKHGI